MLRHPVAYVTILILTTIVPETKSSPKCSDSLNVNDLKGLSTPSLNDPDLMLNTPPELHVKASSGNQIFTSVLQFSK